MQSTSKITCLAVVAALLAGWCCGCGDNTQAESDLDIPQLGGEPGADPPKIKFPPECQQDDVSVNTFITRVLDICQRGDYDKFCALFGISEVPPSHDDFKRIWAGVGEVSVVSVHRAKEEPPQYFVHATVKLRQEDSLKRTKRDIVVRVYKELDEWRISGAPKEIQRKILIADSQPASAPADSPVVQPVRRVTAPSSAPAGYKTQRQGS
jgi:hypothetical protein